MPVNPPYEAEDQRALFLAALEALDRGLDENEQRTRRMKQRIVELTEACRTGRPIAEIVPEEETPLIVQLLTDSVHVLHEYGAELRRSEARVLHQEGMTMDRIARLFGVSRQRVSALLRER
jgi:hypothetical protein